MNIDDLFDMDTYTEEDIIQKLNDTPESFQFEFIKILEKMYFVMKTSIIKSLLYRLFYDDDININAIIRLELLHLFDDDDKNPLFFDRIYDLLSLCELDLTFKLSKIQYIIETYPEYVSKFIELLKQLLCDVSIDQDYRYKCLLHIHHYIKDKTLFTDIFKTCFENDSFHIRNKILLCQYLFHSKIEYDSSLLSQEILLQFLTSILIDIDMNSEIRLDIADMLLNIEDISDHLRHQAISIIEEFGVQKNKFSIYYNQENIHYVDISSIQHILDFLNQHKKKYFMKSDYDYDYIFNLIKKYDDYIDSKEYHSKINVSLIRIQNDRSLYGNSQNSLFDILYMIVTYIEKHIHILELRKRLIEELIEMSGKCTTGYVYRLLNVLSGYDDFSIQIPIEESLKSVLFHKLNQKILDIQDDDLKQKILYEMTLSNPQLKSNFLTFFRTHFNQINSDIYDQFKNDLTFTDYDLYMRKALYNYDGYY
jgi:hypothetical protein